MQLLSVGVGYYLIVAGGCSGSDDGLLLDAVEVYDGHQWRRAQSLPRACSWIKSVVHGGNWYLAGGIAQDHELRYHTSLESLIATIRSKVTGKSSVWKKLPDTLLKWSAPAVLGNHLIIVGGGYPFSSAIHAFSPSTNAWVHMGDLPVTCLTCTVALSAGELLVVGRSTESGLSSFRANIEGDFV